MQRQQALLSLTGPGGAFEVRSVPVPGGNVRTFSTGPQTLRALFEQSRSEQPFLVSGEGKLSFETAWRRAAAVASRLRGEYGIRKGDRVAIAMRNCPEWLIAFQAVTSLGAIAVALNVHWPKEELAYALADAGAKLLFADERTIARLDADPAVPPLIAVRCTSVYLHATPYEIAFGQEESETAPQATIAPDDYATILYTSGSTGRPKGVLSTHRNILTTLMSWELDAAVLALASPAPPPAFPPATLLAVPLFHVTGLHSAYLASFRLQRRVVIMERWNAVEAARLIERERITNLTAPSTITGDLLTVAREGRFDLSSLSAIGGGGAARAASQVRELDRTFEHAVPLTGWGMTETNASGTSIFGEDYLARPESSGRPSFMMDLRIVDDRGNVLPANSRGELQVRGAAVAQVYWRRPDARDQAFDGEWFRTGDVAYLDDEGFVFIVDRIKDVVIRGGENIGCGAVEAVLLDYAGVVEAVVYGLPDKRLGESVAATIRTVGEIDVAALREFLASRLAPFQIPDHVRTVKTALPRTASGKVLRRDARDEALAAMSGLKTTLSD